METGTQMSEKQISFLQRALAIVGGVTVYFALSGLLNLITGLYDQKELAWWGYLLILICGTTAYASYVAALKYFKKKQ